MHIKQELGQLLIIGFRGPHVDARSPVIKDIAERNLGGIIFFDRFLFEQLPENNIVSPTQVEELITALQHGAETPLFVAVDQEGGKVNRFKATRGFQETPPAEQLGNEVDTTATERAAIQTAELLKRMGFNLNLAPVVDLNLHPDNPIIGRYQRSFSNDPTQVSTHAQTWITAHRKNGIICCIKHFPGHGSSRNDSHLDFVDISTFWQDQELDPYRELLGCGLIDCVMTGHLFNRNLDPEFPATLSKDTISGLLRTQLGYDGVVVSDDMQMRAVTSHYGLEEAVCRTINAGVDLLLFGNNLDYDPDICQRVVDILHRGLVTGVIEEKRIEEALQRVKKLKNSLRQGSAQGHSG